MRAAAVLIVLVLIGAPLAQAAPAPIPVLGVELWPADQSLNASYDAQETVFFGRITLENVPYAKYAVFLDACDNPSWATSCTPDYVTFWGSGSADFNISVRVPQITERKTAKIWVESRATYEDTDIAGNVSGMVYLTVGSLPVNTNIAQDGDPFFGGVSGGGSALPYVLVAVAVLLSVGLIVMAVVWRRRRRGRDVIEVTEDT